MLFHFKDNDAKPKKGNTFIHKIFEGSLTNETRCLCCESVRGKNSILNY